LPAASLTSEFFRTSDGVRLHVLDAAPAHPAPEAPVVAFVPGWSMPASIWREQLMALGGVRRTVALDPRGQGRSEIPAHGYTAERRAQDVAEFVARYSRVVLVGWSLGALEALHCLHRHGAGPVTGLVLVDSSVGEEPAPPPSGFLDALRRDRAQALDAFVRAIFRTSRPESEIASLVEGALRLPAKAGIELLSWGLPRTHWRDIARGLAMPLLYAVTPQFAGQAANLAANRPGTRIEVFEHAGHALFVDAPQRFNALVEDFVALPPLRSRG